MAQQQIIYDEASSVIMGRDFRKKLYPKMVHKIILPLDCDLSSFSPHNDIVIINRDRSGHNVLSPISKDYAIQVTKEKDDKDSRDSYIPGHKVLRDGKLTRVNMKPSDQGFSDKLRFLKTYYIFPKDKNPEEDCVLKIRMRSVDYMDIIRCKTQKVQQQQKIGKQRLQIAQQQQKIGRRQSSSGRVQTPQTTSIAKTRDKPTSGKITDVLRRLFGF